MGGIVYSGWSTEAQYLAAEFEQTDTRAVREAQRPAVNIKVALRMHFENEGH